MRPLVFGLILLGACASRRDLTLLEEEYLVFRAENERIRAEDLETRCATAKRKADALSDELLALGHERDRLYTDYDALRSELAGQRRKVDHARKQKVAIEKTLATLTAEAKRIGAALEKQKAANAALAAELEEAQARGRALEARKSGSQAAGE